MRKQKAYLRSERTWNASETSLNLSVISSFTFGSLYLSGCVFKACVRGWTAQSFPVPSRPFLKGTPDVP